MADISPLSYLTKYTAFFLFTTWLFGQMGATVFSSSFGVTSPVCDMDSTGWLAVWSLISCGISNFAFFFTLMSVSTTYQLLGLVLITPLAVGILWIIVAWARGADA